MFRALGTIESEMQSQCIKKLLLLSFDWKRLEPASGERRAGRLGGRFEDLYVDSARLAWRAFGASGGGSKLAEDLAPS